MKKLMRSFFVLTAFLTIAGLTYAQEKEMTDNKDSQVQVEDEKFVALAEDLAADLQTRVKLREDQVEVVQNILVEYFTEVEPVSGISESHSGMDNKMGDMTDQMGVKTDEPTMEKMPQTSETDISGMSDSSDISGISSDMNKTKIEGTDMSDYGEKVHVVEQPGKVSGTTTTPAKDADALGDAFEARQRADNKILEALDEEQKKDYATEKSEWWSDIQDKFESA